MPLQNRVTPFGDIVAIAGIPGITIGESFCDIENQQPLPPITAKMLPPNHAPKVPQVPAARLAPMTPSSPREFLSSSWLLRPKFP